MLNTRSTGTTAESRRGVPRPGAHALPPLERADASRLGAVPRGQRLHVLDARRAPRPPRPAEGDAAPSRRRGGQREGAARGAPRALGRPGPAGAAAPRPLRRQGARC